MKSLLLFLTLHICFGLTAQKYFGVEAAAMLATMRPAEAKFLLENEYGFTYSKGGPYLLEGNEKNGDMVFVDMLLGRFVQFRTAYKNRQAIWDICISYNGNKYNELISMELKGMNFETSKADFESDDEASNKKLKEVNKNFEYYNKRVQRDSTLYVMRAANDALNNAKTYLVRVHYVKDVIDAEPIKKEKITKEQKPEPKINQSDNLKTNITSKEISPALLTQKYVWAESGITLYLPETATFSSSVDNPLDNLWIKWPPDGESRDFNLYMTVQNFRLSLKELASLGLGSGRTWVVILDKVDSKTGAGIYALESEGKSNKKEDVFISFAFITPKGKKVTGFYHNELIEKEKLKATRQTIKNILTTLYENMIQ